MEVIGNFGAGSQPRCSWKVLEGILGTGRKQGVGLKWSGYGGEAWAEDTVRQRRPEGLGAVPRGRRGQACVRHPRDAMGCALQPHLWPSVLSRI